ncbi:MAG TPA: STAS/SEC14 domain-containing protein, partial [Brevundimonas sp.]|uniref:STAS/SEC14 domain-containing protein n=1 Tax=Brevundimonas sp. TaxID=1871086 RepID=UPI002CC82483
GVTPEAFWKDLKFGVERIGQWNRFPHCALVTDAHWLKALAGFWDPILPGIEMKTFPPGETAQAIAWAADV